MIELLTQYTAEILATAALVVITLLACQNGAGIVLTSIIILIAALVGAPNTPWYIEVILPLLVLHDAYKWRCDISIYFISFANTWQWLAYVSVGMAATVGLHYEEIFSGLLTPKEAVTIVLPSIFAVSYFLIVKRKFEGWVFLIVALGVFAYIVQPTQFLLAITAVALVVSLWAARQWYSDARIDAVILSLIENRKRSEEKEVDEQA